MARKDKPNYYVIDDWTNTVGTAIQVSPTLIYKFFGLPFTASATTPNIWGNQGNMQGDTRGNQARMISCTVRGNVKIDDAASVDAIVRIVALWDHEAAYISSGTWYNNFPSTGASPLAKFNGTTVTPTSGTVFSGFNPVNVGKGKRFQVLMDRTFVLSYGGTSNRPFHHKFRVNKTAGFPAAGVVANNILFCFIGDQPGPSNLPDVIMEARVCYVT